MAGVLGNLSRWGGAFLAAYFVNDVTESPRLVQLTGTAMFGPLLVGGVLGGFVSDRFDRRTTMLVLTAITAPLTAVVALLVSNDAMEVWMVYPYLAAMGVGWIADMTNRRAMVHDVVGDEFIDNAMALEVLSLAGGITLGTLLGGSVISLLGLGPAFGLVAGFLAVSFLAFWRVPSEVYVRGRARTQSVAELAEGLRAISRSAVLRSILGVTVITNLMFFAYFPIVQVIADDLGAGPFLTGLLAAAGGLGMMTSGSIVARNPPRRRGLAYVGGTLVGMVLLIGFAVAPWYALAFAFLYLSNFSAGYFSATQTTLVLTAVPTDLRGRALGLLSLSIGALPIGMFLLGEFAEAVGASDAVAIWAAAGVAMLVLFHLRRPEAARLVVDDG